jgi:hypothetical protein
MPGFYNRPKDVDEVVWHIVARVLDQLGIDNDLTRRWGPSEPAAPLDLAELDASPRRLAHLPGGDRTDERDKP